MPSTNTGKGIAGNTTNTGKDEAPPSPPENNDPQAAPVIEKPLPAKKTAGNP